MLNWYSRALEKHPWFTKCSTSGILFSLGDIITQTVFQRQKIFDYRRNLNLFITGSLYIGPALHIWYCNLLPKIANKLFPSLSKIPKTLASMSFDQLAFAPVLMSGFYPFLGFANEPSMNGLKIGMINTKSKLWETMLMNWRIWPLASTINFYFMPMQYQVLFANFVGLFWNMILSYTAHK